jgi:protein-S-isoprenylcysteine O-methyltransferase
MLDYLAYSSPIYGAAFTISFLCWLAFEIWVFSRDRGKERKRARGGSLSVFLALVIGISLALNLPALVPALNIQTYSLAFFVLGILLIWAGLLFRFWSIQTLGRLFSTSLIIQDRHQLITTGPYRYLRNPSYSGAMVTFIGFGLAVGNWLSVIVLLIAGLVMYTFRIRTEEAMLLEAFGQEFVEYKKRSWALIPFIW